MVLGPDGEPLADWEIELTRNGGDATDAGEASTSDTSRAERPRGEQPRGDRNRQDQPRGERGTATVIRARTRDDGGNRDQSGNREQGGNRDQGGNRNNQGGNRNDQGGNRNRNDNDAGEGNNKRRRRRRKGRGGQEGPQGEDVELIEQDHGFESNEPVDVEGYLDIRDEGYGFLRINGYLPSKPTPTSR